MKNGDEAVSQTDICYIFRIYRANLNTQLKATVQTSVFTIYLSYVEKRKIAKKNSGRQDPYVPL